MVKKMQKSSDGVKSGAQLSGTIKDSASQIWLAGLGAFAKAQEEGGKVFDALVKEGMSIQRKTQSAAEEKITEATARMASMASGLSSKATGQWDKLEGIFEERVARALKKLGVPSASEIDALAARVEELNRNVARMNAKGSKAAAPAAGRAAAKTARKQPARKASKSAE
jgi:poly(hydroxyalkanoate) granule-associated protein